MNVICVSFGQVRLLLLSLTGMLSGRQPDTARKWLPVQKKMWTEKYKEMREKYAKRKTMRCVWGGGRQIGTERGRNMESDRV